MADPLDLGLPSLGLPDLGSPQQPGTPLGALFATDRYGMDPVQYGLAGAKAGAKAGAAATPKYAPGPMRPSYAMAPRRPQQPMMMGQRPMMGR